ncbi:MAG: hypothetical protein IJV15_05915 [Lachnospiraceae bacterium]|nr:hypothetical protein [Lachnospiraceae bacterium]
MKKALKGIVFVLILCMLVEGISVILLPLDKVKKYGLYKTSAYEIVAEEEDSVDVIFLGDSLVYSSISPMEIWSGYGFTCYDCAQPAQIMPYAYDYLEVAIESQHPKVVFVEANIMFRDPDKLPLYKKIAYRISNYVPIVKFHSNWKKYFTKSKDSRLNVDKGYIYITGIKPSKKDPLNYMDINDEMEASILPENRECFDDMIKLCEQNNIKLVLLAVPSQKSWSHSKYNMVKELAAEKNVEFIDFNIDHDLEIDWTTETKDRGNHLNYWGAKKVSDYLGLYLYESGLLTDHRDDDDYKLWNTAYGIYKNNMKER